MARIGTLFHFRQLKGFCPPHQQFYVKDPNLPRLRDQDRWKKTSTFLSRRICTSHESCLPGLSPTSHTRREAQSGCFQKIGRFVRWDNTSRSVCYLIAVLVFDFSRTDPLFSHVALVILQPKAQPILPGLCAPISSLSIFYVDRHHPNHRYALLPLHCLFYSSNFCHRRSTSLGVYPTQSISLPKSHHPSHFTIIRSK